MSTENDFNWACTHTAAANEVLRRNARYFLTAEFAPIALDQKRATDYVIVPKDPRDGTIGLRVRRPEYNKWGDMTIRSRRLSGVPTELQKIIELRYPRWYLYAVSDGEGGFRKYRFIDVDALRASNLLNDREEIANKDGCSWFIAITFKELEMAECIVDQGTIKAPAQLTFAWPHLR